MKKFILVLITSLISIITFAQPPANADREKKIESLYIAYITKELKLTESEAQKFWPIHNEYDKEIKNSAKTAAELEKQQQILNVKKKYQPKFINILGNERTDQFFKVDSEFRKRLLERVRKAKKFKE
ncbi:MAG: hypothetical protein JSR00_10540 [Bacteroidetes bacterium]|nr:hypothetical protein [Bacteroidota bacterium]